MIILKRMNWSNWFSYGENNNIDFNKETVTQIFGVNGSGKSSIPLILEEILYNKNSKGIRKQDIPNRYSSGILTAELEFDVDDSSYIIKLKRKSTISIQLFKDNIDISSHTATNTYKTIENILGMSFKTFTQIIYQSSKATLQFLTTTDSQRKTFLISLFKLDKYLEILEIFKSKYKEVSKNLSKIEGTCDTLKKWIAKHEKLELVEKELIPEISKLLKEGKEIVLLQEKLNNIADINKKIIQNNKYIELLSKIDINTLSNPIEKPENIDKYKIKKHQCSSQNTDYNKKLHKLLDLNKQQVCPTCETALDKNKYNKLVEEYKTLIDENTKHIEECDLIIAKSNEQEKKYKEYIKATQEFESLTARIDKSISTDILDEKELHNKISELQKLINYNDREINRINRENLQIAEHNSKVKVITEQLKEYDKQLDNETESLLELEDILGYLDILRKTFSTSGLVSYKIEYLVKDLEKEINKYLQEFSNGQFQLIFAIKGEKLNIDIIDNNKNVNILSLSSGELSKVNISTLLAIRKLMSNISKSKINILFLDEILGVLDQHGKDKLIELLLEEKELNTFLVSHEYTHPLLDKINIIKEKNISRLEYGG